jgi:hypothetical protein
MKDDLDATQPSVVAYMDQLRAIIRDNGWAVQGGEVPVGADHEGYEYAYTIGLLERGCTCELMLVGIPLQIAHPILNEVATDMLNSGMSMPPTQVDLIPNHIFEVRVYMPRPDTEIAITVASLFYDTPSVPMAQLVWSDNEGNYPWSRSWDPDLVQPLGWRV